MNTETCVKVCSVPIFPSHSFLLEAFSELNIFYGAGNRSAARRNFTCIKCPEVSLHTVLQEPPQWLDMRYGTLPLCEEVLNHMMNCLGPW